MQRAVLKNNFNRMTLRQPQRKDKNNYFAKIILCVSLLPPMIRLYMYTPLGSLEPSNSYSYFPGVNSLFTSSTICWPRQLNTLNVTNSFSVLKKLILALGFKRVWIAACLASARIDTEGTPGKIN